MDLLHLREGAPPPHRTLGWDWRRRFEACAEEVSLELVGLNQTLTQLGLPIEKLFMLELVLAEILNNVVEHAYADRGGGPISLDLSVRDGWIFCTITDQGAPMPNGHLPGARRYTPEEMALGDLPEGGFGWGLIHDMSDLLTYQRDGDLNRVSLGIDLASETI
ncbi:ATP-binding protein [Nioella nitratireducens]|uniref:ATP-binding protein n=1 Tax=Nioella nitratireducens TaxID=1287720 RepID=UPI0008FD2367|nr:ATP-binding protein [Nioella nitratireducens]